MAKVKDLECPYCEDTFEHLGSLNRHMYINGECKKIILDNKSWKDVWNDMCRKNS